MTQHADSTLTIDLKAIESNYRLLKQKGGKIECGAVIKANAYGLGVAKVAKALQKAGAKSFFVANLDEAIELRTILPKAKIHVFHGVQKDQEREFLRHNLTPVLITIEQVESWNKKASSQNKRLPALLHVDTGMNRLGLTLNEADYLLKNPNILENIDIVYLMSHLACADESDHPLNKMQLESINKYKQLFNISKATLSNSFGVFLGKNYHQELLRPGCALYGINPTPYKKSNPMQPVVTLTSKVLQVREVGQLQTVGYGATKKLKKGSTIATIPVGYADGFLRSATNNGTCYIKNHKVPIIGRVSMDLITLDVSDIANIQTGMEVELIGENILIDEVASNAGTIGYEILTGLGRRYKRIYK